MLGERHQIRRVFSVGDKPRDGGKWEGGEREYLGM